MNLTPEDLEFTPPSFDLSVLTAEVAERYGFHGDPVLLTGERDQNVLLSGGLRTVLVKVSSPHEPPDVVDLQIRALQHLERNAPELEVPRVLLTSDGRDRIDLQNREGEVHVLRVLSFVPGDSFEDTHGLADSVLIDVGRQQGLLSAALSEFSHPAQQRFMAWDSANGLVDDDGLWEMAESDVLDVADSVRGIVRTVMPSILVSRSQVIHNDGHAGNVLRRTGTHDVNGVIDFGDIVRGAIVNDVAVAASGFSEQGSEGLVATIGSVAAGYHETFPMLDSEIELLYDAVLARLLLTVLLFEFQRACCPSHREYATRVRGRFLAELTEWGALDRAEVTAGFQKRLDR